MLNTVKAIDTRVSVESGSIHMQRAVYFVRPSACGAATSGF